MRALLLHPSLAQDGADQGYLEWLHHGGVVRWRGEAVFYSIFSPNISWWSPGCGPGEERHHHRWCSRAGRTGPLHTGLTTLPIVSLSVKVSSDQTTSDVRNKWGHSSQASPVLTSNYQSEEQRGQNVGQNINLHLLHNHVSRRWQLYNRNYLSEIWWWETFYSPALENILFWENILFL